jgi:molybdopterin synthase sulfur carrier subunit
VSITVRLPTVLRPQANGQSTVDVAGASVGDVVSSLVAEYPGLQSNLLDDAGKVRKFINIYINDEDIRFLDQLDTAVAEGDEVAILPAVAGG